MTNSKTRMIAWAILAMLSYGCSTSMGTRSTYLSDPDYQSRKTLSESLFTSDQNSLTNEAADRLLSSKIKLHPNSHLGVVQLSDAGDWTTERTYYGSAYASSGQGKDNTNSSQFHLVSELQKSKTFKDVTVLPRMVIPSHPSISVLREMAARFQADELLIFKESTISNEIARFWTKDEAKATVTVEAILLDTRTGVIPFSAATSNDIQIRKADEDINSNETAFKAKKAAADAALDQMAAQLNAFLSTIH